MLRFNESRTSLHSRGRHKRCLWFWLVILLVAVLVRAARAEQDDNDDKDDVVDLDSLPVPTPIPLYNNDQLEVHSLPDATAAATGGAPSIKLAVPTNHNNNNHDVTRDATAPTPVSTTSFSEGAYPTDSLVEGEMRPGGGEAGPSPPVAANAKSPEIMPKYHVAGAGNDDIDVDAYYYAAAEAAQHGGGDSKPNSNEVPTVKRVETETTSTTNQEAKVPTVWASSGETVDQQDAPPLATPEKDNNVPTPQEAAAAPSNASDDIESNIGEGAYPTASVSKEKAGAVPTVYDELDEEEPEMDFADRAEFSEGVYPTARSVSKDKAGAVPTVYNELDEEDPEEDVADEAGLSEDKSNEGGIGKPEATETAKKEGSIASFFEKVNKKKDEAQDNLSDTFAAASQIYTAQAKKEGIWTNEPKEPYCGVWGRPNPNRQQPDTTILFELFQDAFVEAVTGSFTKKETEILKEEMGELLESKSAEMNVDDVMNNEPKAKPQLANEFVEGLDDIDKLFEDVDPPDELDIASLGSSMQEILVGRTSHIARKRLMMGLEFMKKWCIKGKDVVVNRFKGEDGRIRFVTRKELGEFGRKSLKAIRKAYTVTVEFIDDLLDSGDSDDDDDTTILGDDAYLREEIQKRAAPN